MSARPFEGFRALRLRDVDARYQRCLGAGFVTAPFEGQPEPETLQCRNEHDRTNWLGLLIKCLSARDMGAGDLPMDPPLRCTSNRMYAVTHNDALERMFVLLDQAARAQANWWRLKDAVRDCPTRAGLADIDLEQGWP